MFYPVSSAIPLETNALRPVRIFKEESIHYTGTTFPGGPYQWCEKTLRRCDAFGYLFKTEAPLPDLFIDLLDKDGDILDSIGATTRGFEYLRRVLRFQRETFSK